MSRWTRGAVAGGVVLAGVLGAGLAHLLPGQAAPIRHDAPSPVESASPGTGDDPAPSSEPAKKPHHHRHHRRLVPPSTPPRPAPARPAPTHTTSGGS